MFKTAIMDLLKHTTKIDILFISDVVKHYWTPSLFQIDSFKIKMSDWCFLSHTSVSNINSLINTWAFNEKTYSSHVIFWSKYFLPFQSAQMKICSSQSCLDGPLFESCWRSKVTDKIAACFMPVEHIFVIVVQSLTLRQPASCLKYMFIIKSTVYK